MSELVGDCNRCGQCCTNGNYRCEFLVVTARLGRPNATRCAKYATRYEGMPIRAVDSRGKVRAHGVCRKDSADETKVIEQWIGHGCSLKRKDDGQQG